MGISPTSGRAGTAVGSPVMGNRPTSVRAGMAAEPLALVMGNCPTSGRYVMVAGTDGFNGPSLPLTLAVHRTGIIS